MTTQETKTYLILKYGSMDKAFAAWLKQPFVENFTWEEHRVLVSYGCEEDTSGEVEVQLGPRNGC